MSKLEDILGVNVLFSTDCIGAQAVQMAKELKPGQVLLLENLRYHKEEKEGNISFAKALSELGDIYINDAFGTRIELMHLRVLLLNFFHKKNVLVTC